MWDGPPRLSYAHSGTELPAAYSWHTIAETMLVYGQEEVQQVKVFVFKPDT